MKIKNFKFFLGKKYHWSKWHYKWQGCIQSNILEHGLVHCGGVVPQGIGG